ncbi:MAG: hypothetical protein QUS09_09525 [Methanotrichaceae archaeon]|nr:hypothetical protein [Methanotrichaceae archaeon]
MEGKRLNRSGVFNLEAEAAKRVGLHNEESEGRRIILGITDAITGSAPHGSGGMG